VGRDGKWWRLKTLHPYGGVQLLNLQVQVSAARDAYSEFPMKALNRRGRLGQKRGGQMHHLHGTTIGCLPSVSRCARAVVALLDTFASIGFPSVNNVSEVFCRGIPTASLSVFNFLSPCRLLSVAFFCKNHLLAAFWHRYRLLRAGTPLPKKMWVVTQSLRQPMFQEITSWKRSHLGHDLPFAMG